MRHLLCIKSEYSTKTQIVKLQYCIFPNKIDFQADASSKRGPASLEMEWCSFQRRRRTWGVWIYFRLFFGKTQLKINTDHHCLGRYERGAKWGQSSLHLWRRYIISHQKSLNLVNSSSIAAFVVENELALRHSRLCHAESVALRTWSCQHIKSDVERNYSYL